MRYLTHEFANRETLDRARRWLIYAGLDPSQIETIAVGTPRIAVKVRAGEAAEAELIIDAAELSDPNGFPCFWDLARQQRVRTRHEPEPKARIPEPTEARTFVVGYHVPDERPDLGASATAAAMYNAFLDRQVF